MSSVNCVDDSDSSKSPYRLDRSFSVLVGMYVGTEMDSAASSSLIASSMGDEVGKM